MRGPSYLFLQTLLHNYHVKNKQKQSFFLSYGGFHLRFYWKKILWIKPLQTNIYISIGMTIRVCIFCDHTEPFHVKNKKIYNNSFVSYVIEGLTSDTLTKNQNLCSKPGLTDFYGSKAATAPVCNRLDLTAPFHEKK